MIRADEKAGSNLSANILYEIGNAETVLFLSGGKTPTQLYTILAHGQRIKIGSVAMIDERYGKRMHKNSNELMIDRTGLLDYLKRGNIPFYPILNDDLDIEETARYYDQTVRYLLSNFSRSAAVLGIGEDGHIAGIAPNRADFINPFFSQELGQRLVSYFIDPIPMASEENSGLSHGFGERVTMTIKGLLKMDVLIVLAFGKTKLAALLSLFEEGTVEQFPLRLLKDKSISAKTILITDQNLK